MVFEAAIDNLENTIEDKFHPDVIDYAAEPEVEAVAPVPPQPAICDEGVDDAASEANANGSEDGDDGDAGTEGGGDKSDVGSEVGGGDGDGGDAGGGEDDGDDILSAMGLRRGKWGCTAITPKQPDKAPPFGGYQARCVWHRHQKINKRN